MVCKAKEQIEKLEARVDELEAGMMDANEADANVEQAQQEVDAKIDELLEYLDQACVCDQAKKLLDEIGMLRRVVSNAEAERGKAGKEITKTLVGSANPTVG